MKINKSQSLSLTYAKAIKDLPKVSIGAFAKFKIVQLFSNLGANWAKTKLDEMLVARHEAVSTWLKSNFPELVDQRFRNVMESNEMKAFISEFQDISERQVQVLVQSNPRAHSRLGVREKEDYILAIFGDERSLNLAQKNQKHLDEIQSKLPHSLHKDFQKDFAFYSLGGEELSEKTMDKLNEFARKFQEDETLRSSPILQKEVYEDIIQPSITKDNFVHDFGKSFEKNLEDVISLKKQNVTTRLSENINRHKNALQSYVKEGFEKNIKSQDQPYFKSLLDITDIINDDRIINKAKDSLDINTLEKIESRIVSRDNAILALSSTIGLEVLETINKIQPEEKKVEFMENLNELMKNSKKLYEDELKEELKKFKNAQVMPYLESQVVK